MKSGYDIAYRSNRKVHELDIQVISASRMRHIGKMIRSWEKCVHTHAKIRVVVHEDIIGDHKTIADFERTDVLYRSLDDDGMGIDEFYSNKPPIGNARAMEFLMSKPAGNLPKKSGRFLKLLTTCMMRKKMIFVHGSSWFLKTPTQAGRP